MPHVIVKMYPASSARQKQEIADEIVRAIMATTGHGPGAISVAVEEVQTSDWTEKVYRPDILEKSDTLLEA